MTVNARIEYDIEKAEAALISEQYEIVLEYCEKIINMDSSCIKAYLLAGKVYLLLDRPSEAERYFRKVIEVGQGTGEDYFNLGNSLFGQKRYSEALENYAKAIQIGCDDKVKKKIYYLMGVLNQTKGERVAALKNYEKSEQIPEINGDQKDILLKRIQIYIETGDLKNAENCAVQLKLLSPEEFKNYQLLFQILLEQKKVDEAEEILKEAIAYCSGNEASQLEIMFNYVLLYCFKAENDPTQKEVYYKQAIEKLDEIGSINGLPEKEKYEIAITKAEIFLKLEHIEDTINILENVAKQNGTDFTEYIERARFTLVESYAYTHDYEKMCGYAKMLKESENLLYKYHGLYTEAYATMRLAEVTPSMRGEAERLYEYAIAYYRSANLRKDAPNMSVNYSAILYRIKAYADIGKYAEASELCKVLPTSAKEELEMYVSKCQQGIGS